jgi:Ca-activated chloride channel family protein
MISNQPILTNRMKRFASKPALIITLAFAMGLTACHQQYNRYEASGKQNPMTLQRDIMDDSGNMEQEAPVTHNTEEYDRIVENEFADPSQTPYSTFSIDVDAAAYANMRRFINQSQMPPEDAVRTEELINYFHYDYPQPTGKHPFAIVTEMATCPWAPEHQLVHIGLQGKEIPTEDLPATNLVFLLDVSGSMGEYNKLPLLKQAFSLLVDKLRPQDRVAIVVYASASGLVLPSTSGEQKWKILEALEKLEAGGSTAGAAGIELAYKVAAENFIQNGNNRVILATDGDFNVGQSSDAALERMIEEKREKGVFLTVLGFGTGNYQDSKMQNLADKGNGNHAYIDNILEARKVLVNEFGGTLFTIAKDVKIQVEFNPAKVKAYRLIGYENRLLNAEDFNDDQKDAGELGSGHTVTALYEIIPAGSSEEVREVDPLRYQQVAQTSGSANRSDELVFVKFRYKAPDGDKSQLIEQAVLEANKELAATTPDFRWSAAVAEFALLLRDSKFKSDASYEQVINLAQNSTGQDKDGYRSEFIGLVKRAQALDNRALTARNK